MVFVFGSNYAGYHGKGAAKYAFEHEGAEWQKGVGRYGNSYAIPTKNQYLHTLPLDSIRFYVNAFIEYTRINPGIKFKVTRIGCGLAGLKDQQMAPMFINAGTNCEFDTVWKLWLPSKKFWGNF